MLHEWRDLGSNKPSGPIMYNGHPIFNEKLNPDNPKFEVGMYFVDTGVYRRAVRKHAITQGRDISFTINEKWKVQVKCKHKTCPWKIYASKGKNEYSLNIKTICSKHKCPRQQKVSHANSKWIAEFYKDKMWSDPRWPVDSMMQVLQKDIKLMFTLGQLCRAKKIVAKQGTGSDAEQYAILWSYAEEIKKTNPGTTVKIKCKLVDGQPMFKRIYICWGALKTGFLSWCRPVIFLDGCHIKTTTGGVILTAVGIDGNNGLYPFAYAVVEKEKKKSWMWFIELLIWDLNIRNNYHWTIMSDKQKGLVDAIDTLLPGCEQRFCVMHLYKNVKLSYKGLELKNLLWKAARATRVVDFETTMAEIKKENVEAYDWLAHRPPAQWSRSHFSIHSRCDVLLNNISESFNSMIMRARNRPIVSMLETIRVILMKRIYIRRDQMSNHDGEFCPKVDKLLEELKKKSMAFISHWNGKDQFEIESGFGSRQKVHLGDQTCTCRRWELTGIPCAHAICGMFFMGYNPEDYVDSCYRKDTFMKTYNNLMNALDGPEMWPKVEVVPLIPPFCQKMPGRPKKYSRKKEIDEEKKEKGKGKLTVKLSKRGVTMTCSKCRKPNHNVRGCPLLKETQKHDGGSEVPAPVQNKFTVKKIKKRLFPTVDDKVIAEKKLKGKEVVVSPKKTTTKHLQRKQTLQGAQAKDKGKFISTQQSQTEIKTLRWKEKLKPPKPCSATYLPSQAKGKGKSAAITNKEPTNKPNALVQPSWKPSGGSSITAGVRFSTSKAGDASKNQMPVFLPQEEMSPVCKQTWP